jgi:hypothetical protein
MFKGGHNLTGHTSLLLGLADSLPKAGTVIGPSGN